MELLEERLKLNREKEENAELIKLRSSIAAVNAVIRYNGTKLSNSILNLFEPIHESIERYIFLLDVGHFNIDEPISDYTIAFFDERMKAIELARNEIIESFSQINEILGICNEMSDIQSSCVRKLLSEDTRIVLKVDNKSTPDFVKECKSKCETTIERIKSMGDIFTIDVVGKQPEVIVLLNYHIWALERVETYFYPFLYKIDIVIQKYPKIGCDEFVYGEY